MNTMTFAQKRQIVVDMKIEQMRADMQYELDRLKEENNNDQDGSFLNDDYCVYLDDENHN